MSQPSAIPDPFPSLAPDSSTATPRRGFLGRMAVAAAALGAGGLAVPLAAQRPAAQGRDAGVQSAHDAWMDRVPGRHRQLFHAVGISDIPMLMAKNFLDSYRDDYGLPAGQVGAAIGIHGPALPIAFTDAAWEKYGFGRAQSITDPRTSEPAQRNVYREGSDLSIEALQGRGILFVLCNTALRLRSASIARASGASADQVYEDLRTMILPGVALVPALVVAIARAQERGFTYLRAS